LDNINKKIIRTLSDNSRITVSELSKLVHLSAPAVKERIEKLEEQQVILGYSLKTNSEALGYAISGFVHADVFTGKESEFKQSVKNCPAITECFNVTGEKAFIFRISVTTMSELDDVLESLTLLCKTQTSLILSETVAPRLPTTF
jgi:Lrp/AsnC family leucine-responsive transcriptional regulator